MSSFRKGLALLGNGASFVVQGESSDSALHGDRDQTGAALTGIQPEASNVRRLRVLSSGLSIAPRPLDGGQRTLTDAAGPACSSAGRGSATSPLAFAQPLAASIPASRG